jgi:hypothetical protein
MQGIGPSWTRRRKTRNKSAAQSRYWDVHPQRKPALCDPCHQTPFDTTCKWGKEAQSRRRRHLARPFMVSGEVASTIHHRACSLKSTTLRPCSLTVPHANRESLETAEARNLLASVFALVAVREKAPAAVYRRHARDFANFPL